MKRSKVLIAGSMAFDSIATYKTKAVKVLGGSASYAAVAASYFADAAPVAVVGTDFEKKHFAPFIKRGVDLSALEVKPGKTFTWAASYDRDFKNAKTLSTQLNVSTGFSPVLGPSKARAQALFLANTEPRLQMCVLEQVKGARFVACDTMNLWINNNKPQLMRLLKKVDILFVNEAEARQLTGLYNLIKAGRAILKYGPEVAVIKLGPNGALLVTKDNLCQVPPYLIEETIDTTGAGDSFGGGFTGYLASVKNWRDFKIIKRAMAIGTVMASFAIESFSINKLASLKNKDIDARLAKYLEMTKL